MKVDDLPPREYWATAVEDIEVATILQNARHRGEERAETEERQRKERERKAAEAQQRLRER